MFPYVPPAKKHYYEPNIYYKSPIPTPTQGVNKFVQSALSRHAGSVQSNSKILATQANVSLKNVSSAIDFYKKEMLSNIVGSNTRVTDPSLNNPRADVLLGRPTNLI